MKNQIFPRSLWALTGLALLPLAVMSVAAQTSSASPTTPNAAEITAPSQTNQVKLSSGVQDVLNLATAQVSEETIVSFIKGSGTIYNLSAAEII